MRRKLDQRAGMRLRLGLKLKSTPPKGKADDGRTAAGRGEEPGQLVGFVRVVGGAGLGGDNGRGNNHSDKSQSDQEVVHGFVLLGAGSGSPATS